MSASAHLPRGGEKNKKKGEGGKRLTKIKRGKGGG